MLNKSFIKYVSAVIVSMAAAVSHAATIAVDGAIDNATGALAVLAGPGTAFSGGFDFDGNVTAGQVILAGFCFTTDALGTPPASATCPNTKSAVPILARGETAYTGNPPAPGTPYDQVGSTFDGNSGLVKLLAFSPSFNVNIMIDVLFNSDGTGMMTADAGTLGTADGAFTWGSTTEVPVPAAAWLFGSALVGLSAVARRRRS